MYKRVLLQSKEEQFIKQFIKQLNINNGECILEKQLKRIFGEMVKYLSS